MTKLGTVLLLLSIAGVAAASDRLPPSEKVDKVVARLDADGDGKISRQEAGAAPRLARRFDAVDENKDGFVTRAELLAALAKVR